MNLFKKEDTGMQKDLLSCHGCISGTFSFKNTSLSLLEKISFYNKALFCKMTKARYAA